MSVGYQPGPNRGSVGVGYLDGGQSQATRIDLSGIVGAAEACHTAGHLFALVNWTERPGLEERSPAHTELRVLDP